MQQQEQEEQEPSFEAMLHAILPLYTALLQAIAALGFRCVRAWVGGLAWGACVERAARRLSCRRAGCRAFRLFMPSTSPMPCAGKAPACRLLPHTH